MHSHLSFFVCSSLYASIALDAEVTVSNVLELAGGGASLGGTIDLVPSDLVATAGSIERVAAAVSTGTFSEAGFSGLVAA